MLTALLLTSSVFALDLSLPNEIKVNIKTEGLNPPPDVTAEAAVIINTDTESVIYEKNSTRTVYPASSVKLMTAILALENIEDFEVTTVISKYVADNTSGNNISTAEGEIIRLIDLLNAMLLFGANDAALALAEYVGGSVDDFVAMMNAKAIELGCKSTYYRNPSGLHNPEMTTTASDTAKIAMYASSFELIMEITSQTRYTIPATNKTIGERSLNNRNHFVSKVQDSQYYYPYARGMNVGSTREAGNCLVTVAQQKGLSYLAVLLGAASSTDPVTSAEKIQSFSDAKSLFEWVFSIYSYRTVVSTKDKIKSVEIALAANKDAITLVPDQDISILLPQNADIEKDIVTTIEIDESLLIAPIAKGQVLGTMTVMYEGSFVGTVSLLSTADVERSNVLYTLGQIEDFVARPWFRASVIIGIVLLAGYIIISVVRRRSKAHKTFR